MIIRELPTDGYLSDETLAALTILGLMLGLLVGLPQWLILRWKYGASTLWLLGSSLGVGLSMFFVLVTNLINMSGVLAYIAAVLVYALTTGLTLVVLINRHVVPDTPISESAGG
jgi:Na+/melibiose symporter-like transporter